MIQDWLRYIRGRAQHYSLARQPNPTDLRRRTLLVGSTAYSDTLAETRTGLLVGSTAHTTRWLDSQIRPTCGDAHYSLARQPIQTHLRRHAQDYSLARQPILLVGSTAHTTRWLDSPFRHTCGDTHRTTCGDEHLVVGSTAHTTRWTAHSDTLAETRTKTTRWLNSPCYSFARQPIQTHLRTCSLARQPIQRHLQTDMWRHSWSPNCNHAATARRHRSKSGTFRANLEQQENHQIASTVSFVNMFTHLKWIICNYMENAFVMESVTFNQTPRMRFQNSKLPT